MIVYIVWFFSISSGVLYELVDIEIWTAFRGYPHLKTANLKAPVGVANKYINAPKIIDMGILYLIFLFKFFPPIKHIVKMPLQPNQMDYNGIDFIQNT